MKEKIGRYLLKRKLKKQHRKQLFLGMKKSKTIGILFDATDFNDYSTIKDLTKLLLKHGKTVFTLGYSHTKTKHAQYIGDNQNGFICKHELNWVCQPVDEYTDEFINMDFDMLFVISNKPWFPIKYIGHLSNAKFKVSKKSLSDEIFDFMIEFNNSPSIKEQIVQMLRYLEMLTGTEQPILSTT